MNKTYTFSINKNGNSSNNNANGTSYIDALISSRLKKTIPYAFNDAIDEDYRPTITFNTEKPAKKTIDIDITIKKNKPYTSLDFNKYIDFMKAIDYLSSMSYDDAADYYLSDGTPVRIFEDEIQIGYELIPFRNMTEKKFLKLKNKNRKAILDLYINISK